MFSKTYIVKSCISWEYPHRQPKPTLFWKGCKVIYIPKLTRDLWAGRTAVALEATVVLVIARRFPGFFGENAVEYNVVKSFLFISLKQN